MSIVKQSYDCTVKLIQVLQSELDRDMRILQVEELLEKRNGLIKGMIGPYSDEEKELGTKLLELEQQVSKLMIQEKILIQQDIKDLAHKKESNKKYVNPYQNLSTDGMFYDKKK